MATKVICKILFKAKSELNIELNCPIPSNFII